ncbi:metallophosphatase family protein [Clostridium sp. MSJ-11]|uniref:Phosphoesterase n=1 Tax=Clostridium mobile TaxID=2841512 RepID=A0ABS6EL01_9CLOT|nr:metallophosphoesterase family protein [Clostridium mobile]MBU5485125.1 metallophosphatase family protein [Clostridium mobile]
MKITKIAIISDTHGLLREEFIDELKNVQLIIHAGDIDKEEVLLELNKICPVVAVRGNCDKGKLREELPFSDIVEVEGKYIYVVHDINTMEIDPKTTGIDIVIFGHSHKAYEGEKDNILYINPGGAGPRRFKLPVSMATLTFENDKYTVKFKYL